VKSSPRVVIVGGGITGLAAAWRLEPWARAGAIQLELWEASQRLGGAIRSHRQDGWVVEGGPDSLLRRKPQAERLCRAVGLGDQLIGIHPAHRGSYIYHRHRLYPIPAGLEAGIPTRLGPLLGNPLLSPWGKMRAAADLIRPGFPLKEDVALGALLQHRFGRQVVERLAEPLLSGIYAGDLWNMSTAATFPHFLTWARQYRSLLWAAGKARGRRSPPDAESPFVTLAGGLETLVERLSEELVATRVVRGRAAATISERSGRFQLQSGDGGEAEADAVVLAAPAWASAAILAKAYPEASEALGGIPYTNLAVVGLVYDPSAVPRPLDRTGFLVPRGEGLEITACTWVSAKWAYPNPPAQAVFRVFLGRARTDVLAQRDGRLLEQALSDLEEVMGRFSAPPLWSKVFRLERGLPQYLVGHRARVQAARQAVSRTPGLVLAGAALDGVGIPDCIRQGEEAAAAVLAYLGLGGEPLQQPKV
jgi:oxygen-dependent protoporphyrinogen oxidase